ncbi:HAMP domain-containing sensor histidine kinase [Sphingomonas sp. JC676]|uniref:sensor histidine kinase n=1 Tax=Sphingomonas sp. JC676 TaxID=2768065 RepID=UPI00292A5C0A|nr:HAMP domain-containing sensor histidine kinase [Sphingomonas sp. JC676]
MGQALRFDDTLETVLAADLNTPYGAHSAWRQLVDLIGRRRVAADARAMATLRAIRAQVPAQIRAASARALEFANPPAPLVRLFALDDIAIGLPVLRTARLASAEWVQLLPELAPAARAVLRNRRDLGPVVKRALESFGPIDFVLSDESDPSAHIVVGVDLTAATSETAEDYSFIALVGGGQAPAKTGQDEIATGPVQSGTVDAPAPTEIIAQPEQSAQLPSMDQGDLTGVYAPGEALDLPELDAATSGNVSGDAEGPFEIAEVVARIDAFWRDREETGPRPFRAPLRAEDFRFETDAKGIIRWVAGVSRAPIVGLSLDFQGTGDGSSVDGIASGAFRRRASFSTARMTIDGDSEASGDWLISAVPVFDPANGRFTGYRGTARRPRVDERAEPVRAPGPMPADSLRQLVHELRTPTNAIAGFAEMIETQMLGPVADPYRDRAHVIRSQARELLGAIDDLDLAARIDSAALALVPSQVHLRPLISGIADDLSQLAELRGSIISLPVDDLIVDGDRRAVERLLARLLATLVSASGAGERIGVQLALENDAKVAITIDRPAALADYPGDSVLGIDDEREDATLLGTGFALRLARNLARELGGSLVIAPESLTLRLPASVNGQVGQAHLS